MSTLRFSRSALLALGLFWLSALAGCNGCGGLKTKAVVCKEGDCCKTNQDCYNIEKAKGDPDPKNYFCDVPVETCFPIIKTCKDQGQCCPGQSCSATLSQCVDSYTACTTNADCYIAGQYCDMTLGSFPTGPGCTFNTCNQANGSADCAAGLSCFDGYCVGQPPCGGGCADGEVCTPVNNQCFKLDNPTTQCQETCQAGYMLVFTYGQNVFNLCDPLEKADCECEALPPIQSDDLVRYSSAVVAGSNILISAYDAQYGDLVMHTFNKSGTEVKVEWVDGVPTTGTITGDPNGPRSGRADPGPDVGRYTSIAYSPASSGTTYIAYYAAATDGAENINTTGTAGSPIQALRLAIKNSAGQWSTMTVDGWDGVTGTNTSASVGRYTSITISPDGAPVIAYFEQNGAGGNNTVSAIKVARATKPQPQSAADFIITTVETGAVPAPPMTPVSPVDLPPGDGLFTGIGYLGTVPVVVWYDANNKVLKGAIASADSADRGANFNGQAQILDNGLTAGNTTQHDVGRYASIAIGPSTVTHRIAITYADETTHQTKLITADVGWANLAQTIIDNGQGAVSGDTQLMVGSDSSAAFLNGLLSVTYQDQTSVTLRLATQASASAPVAYKSVLDSDGAGGFYGRLISDGTNLYVSHAVIQANLNGMNFVSANKLHVLKVQ